MKYDGIKQINCTSSRNNQNILEVKHEYRLIKILALQLLCSLIILGAVFGLPAFLPQTKTFSAKIADAFKYNIEALGTENEEVGRAVFDKNEELIEAVSELFKSENNER